MQFFFQLSKLLCFLPGVFSPLFLVTDDVIYLSNRFFPFLLFPERRTKQAKKINVPFKARQPGRVCFAPLPPPSSPMRSTS